MPFASVIAPRWTRHQAALQRRAAVGGERAGHDTVAVAVAALDCHRTVHGRLRLKRPDVVAAVHRAAFLLEDHRVEPLDGVPAAVGTVLRWSGRWAVGACRPVEALLEPLRPHFDIGPREVGWPVRHNRQRWPTAVA